MRPVEDRGADLTAAAGPVEHPLEPAATSDTSGNLAAQPSGADRDAPAEAIPRTLGRRNVRLLLGVAHESALAHRGEAHAGPRHRRLRQVVTRIDRCGKSTPSPTSCRLAICSTWSATSARR